MEYCFIGNSHVDQFNINAIPSIARIYKMGASIKGLTNPNSKLHLAEAIQTYCDKNPSTTMLFFLGQVDVEFGYYYKCVKDAKKYDIADYVDDLILRYESYLKTVKNKFCVLCINPMVITDNRHIYKVCFNENNGREGEYSEATSLSFDDVKEYLHETFEEKFEYNKLFNSKLEEMCKRNQFKYINFWPHLFENGVLKSKYKPNRVDHHLVKANDRQLLEYVLQRAKPAV